MKRAILLLPLLLLLSSGAPAQAPAQPPADKKQAWGEQVYEKQLTLLGSRNIEHLDRFAASFEVAA